MTLTRREWLLLAAGSASGQSLAVGNLLVATPKSRDPDFARSVVLLVHSGPEGAVGIMLNRPTGTTLSTLFPEHKQATGIVYRGGPIDSGVRALLWTDSTPAQSEPIASGVFLLTRFSAIDALVAARKSASRFRVYAGYTGWTLGQLKYEVSAGFWHVHPVTAGLIFDPHPKSLWARLALAA